MYKEISLAKFGLCSGGITTYEFATLDVPFAILCQVQHQTITAKVWENYGAALNLGLNKENTRKKIMLFLENIKKIELNKNNTKIYVSMEMVGKSFTKKS